MENEIIKEMEEKMLKAIENLEKRFLTVRAGRANPATLDTVMVSYYGVDTPLKQLATIAVPEARQLLIKPFDKTCIPAIEKAIFEANLGYTPGNDGDAIRIVIPALTEERRIEYTKQVKAMAEEAKVAIRNIRRDGIEDIENIKLPEDVEKGKVNEIQDLVNEYNKSIDALLKEKEQELLSI